MDLGRGDAVAAATPNEKRVHSVKVARLYKVAAGIVSEHREGGASVKSLVYESKKKHPNLKAVYALASECARRKPVLDRLIEESRILRREGRLNESLARVLMAEILWGKGSVAGGSRPAVTVTAYEPAFRALLRPGEAEKLEVVRGPRFVRINRLKGRPERVLKTLRSQGYRQVAAAASATTTFEAFRETVEKLESLEFVADFHLDDVFVFHPRAEFFANPLYKEGAIVLQDKASCLTVAALQPPRGSHLLDACAAPGMKTIQAAAADVGSVVAVEKSKKRCATLRRTVAKHGASKLVEVLNEDFTEVDPADHERVEYIVLDPSCSGSGIRKEAETDASEERIRKLASLQSKLLRHALSFANVKRVAYSTCSTRRAENEDVVLGVLARERGFGLKKGVLPRWKRRGIEGVDRSEDFIRADPDADMCNGFFVAVLERR